MKGVVDSNSVAVTVDRVVASFFYARPLTKRQAGEVIEFLVSRQGLEGAYAGMFAPTEKDFCDGVKLFTGERLKSRASVAHILGQEASRALILLGAGRAKVAAALDQAGVGMLAYLTRHDSEGRPFGMYCCGQCSVSLWRHLSVGGLGRQEKRLHAGIGLLKSHRDGEGRWKRFPFYYTLLALSELEFSAAKSEMRYAAAVLARGLKIRAGDDIYRQRRRDLAEKLLSKC